MAECYDDRALNMIPHRKTISNKGTYGHALIIAGSMGMSGAAYLSSLATYKTGAGLVRIWTPECNRQILQILLPEAIVDVYEIDSVINRDVEYTDKIDELIEWADVVVLGPGLGMSECSERIVEDIMEAVYVPMIIDADAINIISNRNDLLKYYREQIIITPHPGEMSRLSGIPIEDIVEHIEDTAKEYATTHGIICVLKSHESIVASSDGRLYLNTSGTPALAKGGSGDVLTGIIAGLICLGLDEWKSATLGVYIHGRSGQLAMNMHGEHGVLARDVAGFVPEVMKR